LVLIVLVEAQVAVAPHLPILALRPIEDQPTHLGSLVVQEQQARRLAIRPTDFLSLKEAPWEFRFV
jgi:hypothetical protein